MDDIRLHVVPCTNAEKDAAGNATQAYTVTIQQFSDLIDRVNGYFAAANIKFMFDPRFDWAPLADTELNTDGKNFRDRCNAMAAELPGQMLCVLRWGNDPAGQTGNGNAYPPPGAGPKPPSVNDVTQNYVALPSGLSGFGLLNQGNGTFVAHEFGHFFGLYHTFPGWTGYGPVFAGFSSTNEPTKAQALAAAAAYIAANGGTAEAMNGDGLADTPPDPGITLWRAHNLNICTTDTIDVEVGTGSAKKTVSFAPDANNIMSYFPGCPDSNAPGASQMTFSADQIARMRSTLKHKNRETLTATPLFGQQSLQARSAVAPAAGRLQVIAADAVGRVWLAHWDAAKNGGKWDRWRPVLPVNAPCLTRLGVATRDATRLDIFLAGNDGRVHTGARRETASGGPWKGWWDVMAAEMPPGGAVEAVARSVDQLDAFIVGNTGFVYTAAWAKSAATWAGWWQIGALKAPPGAPVAAVARTANDLDVLVADKDGKIHASGWSPSANSGQWRAWKWVAGGVTAPGGAVSVVSRHPDRLDAFTVGTDGRVYTAAWHKGSNQGEWAGWWPIGIVTAPPGAPVTAVARNQDTLDIFVIGSDGSIYASSWGANVNSGNWKAWAPVLTGKGPAGSAVAAVARTPLKLDIFILGQDGGIWTAAWEQKVNGASWKGWWRLP